MVLEIKSIKLIRNRRLIIDKFNLKIKKSQIFILVGKNGSGKSTIMDLVVGLIKPYEGNIKILNHNLDEIKHLLRDYVFYLHHENSLKDNLTVRENLEIWLDLLGFRISNQDLRLKLNFFDLEPYIDFPVGKLSHGQKKKVALTKLFFTESLLWLLDEPFNGIDKSSSKKLSLLIENFAKNGGAVLLSSHIDINLKKSKKILMSNISSRSLKKNPMDWSDL